MYRYQDGGLRIPSTAEMSRDFYPNGKYHKLVQDTLNQCAEDVRKNPKDYDWRSGRVMDFTLDLEPHRQIEQYVVAVAPDDKLVYGHCRLHKARSPQDSPFVVGRRPVLVSALTIELVRAHDAMLLVRAYGGEYAPPLPWQASVGNYEGGIAKSREFWRSHAFVMARSIAPQGRLNPRAPKWTRELVS